MLISCDTEVGGLESRRGLKPFMLTVCDEFAHSNCWEWEVNPKTREVNIPKKDLVSIADRLSGNEVIFHHGQFDLRIMANAGLNLKTSTWQVPIVAKNPIVVPVAAIHETLFASHLVDSRGVYKVGGKRAKSTHALKELCLVRLNVSDRDELLLRKAVQRARTIADKLGWKIGEKLGHDYWLPKALFDYVLNQASLNVDPEIEVPKEWGSLCRDYGLNDVVKRTMPLFLTCREILQSEDRWNLYLEAISDLPMIYMLEEGGIRIDPTRLRNVLNKSLKTAASHQKKIIKLAGDPNFNLKSPKQLSQLLFQRWALPATRITKKTGAISTNADALKDAQKVATGNAKTFLDLLIGYDDSRGKVPGMRSYLKTAQYLTSYESLRIKEYLYPTIHGAGTGTSRWSMSNPNGQNVGKKEYGEEGDNYIPALRSVFGPEAGHIWFSIDYAQLEPRIFATLARDEAMLEAFDNGYDFHQYTAEMIDPLFPGMADWELRRTAKAVNFKTLYGGINSIPHEIAKKFPSARRFMDETIEIVKSQGYVETADGYPLYCPSNEPYKGTDYRVQGTAGRIIKLAMRWLCYGRRKFAIDLNDSYQEYLVLSPLIDWKTIKIVVQIHDELVFDIDSRGKTRKDVSRVIYKIMEIMEQAGQSMNIITPVEGKVHLQNWQEGISIRDYIQGIAA